MRLNLSLQSHQIVYCCWFIKCFWLALLVMCGLILGRMPLAAVLGFSHKTSFAESVYKASSKTYIEMLVFRVSENSCLNLGLLIGW